MYFIVDLAGSSLHVLIQKEFQMSSIETVKRKYFNESQGLQALETKATKVSLMCLRLDSSFFLGLAAVACLLKFMEYIQGVIYAPGTLHVCLIIQNQDIFSSVRP